MSDHKVNYIVAGERMTEDEYRKLFGNVPNRMHTFDGTKPYGSIYTTDEFYDGTLKENCTSLKDREKKVKKFNRMQRQLPPELRDRAHPDGFSFVNDNHKFMQECKYLSKHKREYREWQRKKSNCEYGAHLDKPRGLIVSYTK